MVAVTGQSVDSVKYFLSASLKGKRMSDSQISVAELIEQARLLGEEVRNCELSVLIPTTAGDRSLEDVFIDEHAVNYFVIQT